MADPTPTAEDPTARSGGQPASRRLGLLPWFRTVPPTVVLTLVMTAVISVLVFAVSEYAFSEIGALRQEAMKIRDAERDLHQIGYELAVGESAQRGYLLTWDPRYLAPYQQAIETARNAQAHMVAGIGNNPRYAGEVLAIAELIQKKVDDLNVIVHLSKDGRMEEAVQLVRAEQGISLMEAFMQRKDKLQGLLRAEGDTRVSALTRLFQQQRVAVGITVALNLIFLAVLGARTIQQFHERERTRYSAVTQAAELEQTVRERTDELAALSTYLQNQTEQEKAKLARDLHDEFGALLTSAMVDVAWLQGRNTGEDAQRTMRLQRLGEVLNEAVQLKRRVIESLRPSLLDHLGLAPALKWYVQETCSTAGIEHDIDVPEETTGMPADVSTTIYRIVQEALNNTVKYAKARRVRVELEEGAAGWSLVVQDDGIGIRNFQPGHLSHGLAGMRHRAQALGGTLQIHSAPGAGTRIVVAIPQPAANSPSAEGGDAQAVVREA